jgi:hypothetical protein
MSVTHRSLSVAVESSFGSLSSTTGLPDNSGLSFTSIPCERDPIIVYGDPVVSERNDARDGTFGYAPEPDTVWASGSRVRRRTGQVTLRLDLTTVGSSLTNYETNYLGKLLAGGFKSAYSSSGTDSITAISDVNTFTPTTGSNYIAGGLIGVDINGRAEYSAVTDTDVTGDVTVSPAFSSGFTGTPTAQLLQTWYAPQQTAELGATRYSLSFRVDGVNFRSYAYGCRLESMTLSLDNGRVMADLTYQAALIQDDHASAVGPVEPSYNSGAPCFFRGSYAVISSGSPTSLTDASTGDTLGRIALDVDDFTLTVTNTLTPKGHSNSILAMSDMEVTDVDVELTLTLSNVNTTINDDFFNRTLRQVLVGFGPLANGQGGAFQIPAAYLTVDPSKYDPSGNDIVRQQLTYKASRFGGDIDDGSYEAWNSPFRLALGKG